MIAELPEMPDVSVNSSTVPLVKKAESNAVSEASNSSQVSFRTKSSAEDFPFSIECYYPSLAVVLSGGVFLVILSAPFTYAARLCCGALSVVFALFLKEWLGMYGMRLTREEHVYFDEKNILETTKGFEFMLAPMTDDTTPGGACCGPYPMASLLSDALADPAQKEMQEFYKKHYGNMYQIAFKAHQEAKAAEQADMKPGAAAGSKIPPTAKSPMSVSSTQQTNTAAANSVAQSNSTGSSSSETKLI